MVKRDRRFREHLCPHLQDLMFPMPCQILQMGTKMAPETPVIFKKTKSTFLSTVNVLSNDLHAIRMTHVFKII
jgi:hypothetical protein